MIKMEVKDVKPELLDVKDIIDIFQAYNIIGQICQGSTLYKLFAHIAALTAILLIEKSKKA
jgi:hypothetical protein